MDKKDKKDGNGLNRRNFFKFLGATGAVVAGTCAASKVAEASDGKTPQSDKPKAMGVLVDTTMCAGCRSCEMACIEQNKLPAPPPEEAFENDKALDILRDTSTTAYTVVNKYEISKDLQVTRKQQCMHCVEPACSSACIIKAMEKRPNGAVAYRDDLCIGCRYCMVACPFDVPKFEYAKAAPLIKKCQFCFQRQEEGKQPACVENCPAGALTFGPRDELIEEAKKRIYTNPDAYVHHVYGEHEAGGTSWLYIAAAPFEKLGLPKLDKKAYPELTLGAMGTVPVVMLVWPALLMAFHHFTHGKDDAEHGGNHK